MVMIVMEIAVAIKVVMAERRRAVLTVDPRELSREIVLHDTEAVGEGDGLQLAAR